MKNALVQVSSHESTTGSECGRHEGNLNRYWTNITCSSPILGQWVKVTLLQYTLLQFYEVEVEGY